MVGGRQHGGFEWASRALSLRWFISDSAHIMEYQGACTEALLVSASSQQSSCMSVISYSCFQCALIHMQKTMGFDIYWYDH